MSNSIYTIFFNPHPRTCLLILKGREGREREREKNIDVREKHQLVASCTCPNCDQTCNVGKCPDQELNLRHFGLWG